MSKGSMDGDTKKFFPIVTKSPLPSKREKEAK